MGGAGLQAAELGAHAAVRPLGVAGPRGALGSRCQAVRPPVSRIDPCVGEFLLPRKLPKPLVKRLGTIADVSDLFPTHTEKFLTRQVY